MFPFALLACGPGGTAPGPMVELEVSIGPDDPVLGLHDLVCSSPGAAEPAFRWTADGVEVAGDDGEHPGDTIPADRTRRGHTWRCEVTTANGAGAAEITPRAQGGNVLLLLIDDLGRENLAFEGVGVGPFPHTPNLEALASTSLRFVNAWSTPVCSPTRAGIVTGRMPRHHGIGDPMLPTDPYALPDDEVFLPQVLAQAPVPVTSELVGKWHLNARNLGTAETQPLHAGFARWRGSHGNLQTAFTSSGAGLGYFDWEYVVDGEPQRSTEYATEVLVRDAVETLGRLEPPWFLFVSFNAPHDPFHVPPEGWRYGEPSPTGPGDREKLSLMVESVDIAIGQILDAMTEEQRATTTILTVADNGTMYTVVGEPWDRDTAKGSVFQGGVNVPFYVSGPLVEQPGATSDALVHTNDVFDTALALAGVLPHEVDALVGREPHLRESESFLPYLARPDRPSSRRLMYTEKFIPNGPPPWDAQHQAVRDERYKVVRQRRLDTELLSFFDLWTDPTETTNLLVDGAVPGEHQAGWEALDAELARVEDELLYDY